MGKQKQPWVQLDQHARWIARCGLAQILTDGEWRTLLALMDIETALVGLKKPWAEKVLWGWFHVRVSEELTEMTGLTRQHQAPKLRSLQDTWNLITVEMGRGPQPTVVRFVGPTIKALADYSIPRLMNYQGGLRNVKPLPERLHWWIRPNMQSFRDATYEVDDIARIMDGVGQDEKPSEQALRSILSRGYWKS